MNDEELAAINRLVAALQVQTDGQAALNVAIRLLAQSNQALVDLIKSREPDPKLHLTSMVRQRRDPVGLLSLKSNSTRVTPPFAQACVF